MSERGSRILLADDHPVIATGIRLALKQVSSQHELQCVEDPSSAIALCELWRPEAVILDLVFNGVIEADLVRHCRAAAPQASIVVFSSLPAATYAEEVKHAGADAFVGKDTDLDVLVRTLARLMGIGSEIVLPNGNGGTDGAIHLTRRENEIARLLSHGTSVAEIAERMGISPKTAAVHRDNLRKKLGCRDTNELIARLARHYAGLEDT